MAYLNVEKVANILARSVPLLAKVDVGARVVLSADPAPLIGWAVVDLRYVSMNNNFLCHVGPILINMWATI